MKTLQSNYTTPEQSKILLELGLPADSADMLWDGTIDANEGWIFEDFPIYSDKPFSYYQLLYRQEDTVHILPCWSVGRLMEIHDICIEDEDAQYGWAPAGDYNYIDYIISRFEEEIIYFFKLEK
jgi:hypothetical protein